jgi:hypothetical protein
MQRVSLMQASIGRQKIWRHATGALSAAGLLLPARPLHSRRASP